MIDARFLPKNETFDWSVVTQQVVLLGFTFSHTEMGKPVYKRGGETILVCVPCQFIKHNDVVIRQNKIYEYLKTIIK